MNEGGGRRRFLSLFGWGWLAFSAAMSSCGAAMARLLYPNVLFEPPSKFVAGFPQEFEIGRVDARFKAKQGVFLVRTARGIYALLAVCTHLGCTPNWFGLQRKFKCPCHGSGFDILGTNEEGPAPRPLERVHLELSAEGRIVVDKSLTYREELGEWELPGAFLELS